LEAGEPADAARAAPGATTSRFEDSLLLLELKVYGELQPTKRPDVDLIIAALGQTGGEPMGAA
ncbi:MAG TPA: hypothetical protein VEP28_13345, partial [Rubrobacter sp.]|nr:hypothetical protein [Rubrobacter sp.]